MVGMMAINSREKLATLINSAKLASDIASKLDLLREFKKLLPQEDPVLLTEFLPSVFDLLSDRFSPIRKYVTEMVGEIGSKNIEFLPEIVPMLRTVLDDSTPAVSRQAISLGTKLFRLTLEKIAIQGLYSSELDSTLESAWAWMVNFKEKIYTIAFQPGSSGTRLLALKFVEAVICLYTPHPNGLSEPPSHDVGSPVEFSISWLRRGHPVLNIRDLSVEASQNLGILLDLLRFPAVKSLSNSMIIVLINSLSKIANERPAFYGRILPVLLGLEPSSSIVNSVQIFPAHCALRKAFLTCLKCTHPSAAPWRERLSDALKEIESGKFRDKVLYHPEINNGVIMKTEDEDEKPMMEGEDILDSNIGRKRSKPENGNDLAEGEDAPGKKVRPMGAVSEGSNQVLNVNVTVPQERDTCNAAVTVKADVDNGPAQQLVGMFGALLAQGEKAVGSLEILISSISADLLAEVVIATMRNLPPNHPSDDNNDELLHNMSIIGSDENARYPPSFIAGVMSLSSTFPPVASLLDVHQSLSCEVEKSKGDDETSEIGVDTVSNFDSDHTFGNQTKAVDLPSSAAPVTAVENGISTVPSDTHDVGNLESEIPGLDSYVHNDRLSDTVATSSLASTDVEDASQEQLTNAVQRSPSNLVPSLSTDKSEELSPKAAVTDASSLVSSTATSIQLPPRLVLPKMMAPVVDLPDEQKDNLQKLAFSRIVDAYKQIAVAGGTQVYISLLPSLAIEYPLELDPWKLLQKHILADYTSYEGQELTLRVLYRLYGEAEEDSDFFSSTTAASVYETFLLTVTEALKDSFPPSDKSLSRLLGDAPYLPKSVLKILESMCSPENHDTGDKESQGGDRVTQGLSSVWALILQRPPFRDACLKIALQSAVHCLEEVRMKAIRLVANKLYPLSYLAQQIEDFAKEMLFSIINSDGSELMDAEASSNEPKKEPDEDKPSNEQLCVTGSAKDVSPDAHQSSTSPSASVQPLSEAQRCLSLYFALCTKKHSLFGQIFVIYRSASKAVKQAIHRHIPILVRTMGPSPDLLEIISDPPSGSDNLLMQVLHTLTDGTVPSKDLILTVRKLYDSKGKDAEVLLPVLPFLSKEEVMLAFPRIVSLPPDKFQTALARTLQGAPVLTPAEVLIAIHGIDPERDGIPLKKVTDACNVCFEQRQTFTQQVLAKVLNQLVEQIPLPLLFMRTVLQAIGAFPALVDFIMEILSRLVSKQIWKYPKLWVGFLKCAQLTKPQSFSVLLQLPPAQLENALNRIPALKAPLVAHATQSTVQPSLPRSLLVVLGIVPDSQALSQAQTSQVSQAQTSQVSQSQTSQLSQSQTSQTSQGQTSQAQTSDTHDSDKEASAEKSKESSNASRSAVSGS